MSDDRTDQRGVPEPSPLPPPVFDEPAHPAPPVVDPPLRNEEF